MRLGLLLVCGALVASRVANADDHVTVHVVGNQPISLERQEPNTGLWLSECYAECDALVPTGLYRMRDAAKIVSRSFSVEDRGRTLTLTEEVAKKNSTEAGAVLLATGGVAGVGGIILLVMGFVFDIGDSLANLGSGGTTEDRHTAFYVLGASTLGVSTVLTLLGVTFLMKQVEARVYVSSRGAGLVF